MKLLGPDGEIEVPVAGARLLPDGTLRSPEGQVTVAVARDGDAVWVSYEGHVARYERARAESGAAAREVRAPMTGRVVAVKVAAGDDVAAGQVVAILEAMKMEYRLEAAVAGKVASVEVAAGALVELGQTLVTLS